MKSFGSPCYTGERRYIARKHGCSGQTRARTRVFFSWPASLLRGKISTRSRLGIQREQQRERPQKKGRCPRRERERASPALSARSPLLSFSFSLLLIFSLSVSSAVAGPFAVCSRVPTYFMLVAPVHARLRRPGSRLCLRARTLGTCTYI